MDDNATAANPFFLGRVALGYLRLCFAARLFVEPNPGLVLANTGLDNQTFQGKFSSIPDLLRTLIADPETLQEYTRLVQNLTVVNGILERGYNPSDLETAVIRTLIMHNWRRIVWRQSDLSVELLKIEAATQCRKLVWETLNRLERPSIYALDTARVK